MGWFSPIKGHYPSLGQLDKTLPVASGSTAIQRGMIIKVADDTVNPDGKFEIATNGTGLLYIALQDYDDAQAGMAGSVGFDGNVPSVAPGIPGVTAGVPTITGLALDMEGEYETSMFDATSITDETAIGTPLTVSSTGYFKVAGTNDTAVAYLTGNVTSRWVNNAVAKANGTDLKHTAVRQGKNVPVIRFRTK